jgi:hypothetical protein
MIIAPKFDGDLMTRFKEISDATNIIPWFMSAESFSELALKANSLQPTHRKLIKFSNLFLVGEVCNNPNVNSEMDRIFKLITMGVN